MEWLNLVPLYLTCTASMSRIARRPLMAACPSLRRISASDALSGAVSSTVSGNGAAPAASSKVLGVWSFMALVPMSSRNPNPGLFRASSSRSRTAA